ncbi:CbiX/SirB N-terminal domain-containing protein [Streptomyces sp. NPDC048636]|uniref:sirohydrochlorin chelatase n=1 Tax=Streptomyces sp. NPDC048636 TaxID=3155762 RepID=UPI00342CF4CA
MNRITAQLHTQLSRGKPLTRRRPAPSRSSPSSPSSPPTLVAVAHGSRDPGALRTVTALLDRVRALRPEVPVRLGHIELNQPLLTDTLAALRGDVVVVPLLLGRGHHIKRDIPAAVAAAPHLAARIAAPLGPHPLLAEALHTRLAEAGRRPLSAAVSPATGVVLAAAGSNDPDAAIDTARTVALLSTRLGGVPVLPGHASGAGPGVPDALRALAALGHERVAVASYFTAPGRFARQCAEAAPGAAAAPLGAHPAVARLVLHRYEQALTNAPLSHRAVTVGV